MDKSIIYYSRNIFEGIIFPSDTAFIVSLYTHRIVAAEAYPRMNLYVFWQSSSIDKSENENENI